MIKLTEKKIEVVQIELTKKEAYLLLGVLTHKMDKAFLTSSEKELANNIEEGLKPLFTIDGSKIKSGIMPQLKLNKLGTAYISE